MPALETQGWWTIPGHAVTERPMRRGERAAPCLRRWRSSGRAMLQVSDGSEVEAWVAYDDTRYPIVDLLRVPGLVGAKPDV
jgi:hypothetical protein